MLAYLSLLPHCNINYGMQNLPLMYSPLCFQSQQDARQGTGAKNTAANLSPLHSYNLLLCTSGKCLIVHIQVQMGELGRASVYHTGSKPEWRGATSLPFKSRSVCLSPVCSAAKPRLSEVCSAEHPLHRGTSKTKGRGGGGVRATVQQASNSAVRHTRHPRAEWMDAALPQAFSSSHQQL